MKMKHLQIVLCCLVWLPFTAMAPTTVTGVVLDANGNLPLIRVTVLEAQID